MDTFTYTISITSGLMSIAPACQRIGHINDNLAQTLAFVRPDGYDGYNLVLLFKSGGKDSRQDLGIDNSYIVPRKLTKTSTLLMQAAFYDGSTLVQHTNIAKLLFGASITPDSGDMDDLLASAFTSVSTSSKNDVVKLVFGNLDGDEVGEATFTVGGGGGGGDVSTVNEIAPDAFGDVTVSSAYTTMDDFEDVKDSLPDNFEAVILEGEGPIVFTQTMEISEFNANAHGWKMGNIIVLKLNGTYNSTVQIMQNVPAGTAPVAETDYKYIIEPT